ncbi:MAG: SDR family oxidoreductase, partial [Candidatus Korobacteraceae bacterium]
MGEILRRRETEYDTYDVYDRHGCHSDGGSRGIGYAIAETLGHMGATVVIAATNAERLDHAVRELSRQGLACDGFVCDVADLNSVSKLGEHVRNRCGRVDVLVNNAGVGEKASLLHELDPMTWDKIFNTNVRGAYYMMRALVPLMMESGGGHVINISSLAGKNPLPRGAAYSASKWAMNGLSYSAAEELRAHNIRVSVVCPGSVDTEFSPHSGKSPDQMLRPEDVAHVVAMLVTQRPQSFV